MVKLSVVNHSNLEFVKKQPLVAVFVGGTSGIGEYTLRALANTHADVGKGLRAYIVGRNAGAALKLTEECEKVCPRGQFIFVQAEDLALLRDCDKVCEKIAELEHREASDRGETPRIDFLVMSHASPPWWPQKETVEGLDQFMSFLYYSRMRITTKLLPLLTASSMPAHVISVYAGGMEAKLITDDLSLREPGHWSMSQVRSHVAYMTTLFNERLAQQNSGKLSLIHVFPGLVNTPAFNDPQMPMVFKVLWRVFGGLISWAYAVSQDECGARMLYLATQQYPARGDGEGVKSHAGTEEVVPIAIGTDGVPGSGAYAINWNNETVSVEKAYSKLDKQQLSKMVNDHTEQAFDEIAAGNTFQN